MLATNQFDPFYHIHQYCANLKTTECLYNYKSTVLVNMILNCNGESNWLWPTCVQSCPVSILFNGSILTGQSNIVIRKLKTLKNTIFFGVAIDMCMVEVWLLILKCIEFFLITLDGL